MPFVLTLVFGRRTPSRVCFAFVVLGWSVALSGCQSGYLLRQWVGQLSIACGAVDIKSRLQTSGGENTLDREVLEKLALVQEVRLFAEQELGLEPGDAYTTYYETGGKPVSYAVSAAHPTALVPYLWAFPIVGKVPYKGYFQLSDARSERDRLARRGWDTSLSAVEAFSTLGWFRDPILSTMLDRSDGKLVELLLHELTHRTVFFKGEISFNESLATVVANTGTRMFLARHFGEDSCELASYLQETQEEDFRNQVFRRLRNELEALYRSSLPEVTKLKRKAEVFRTGSLTLASLSPEEPPPTIPPSNAFVLAREQYHQLVPLIEKLLDKFSGEPKDLMAFLKGIISSGEPLAEIRQVLTNDCKKANGEPSLGRSCKGTGNDEQGGDQ